MCDIIMFCAFTVLSEFTLTCCKWCGEMFIEEDSVWPTQCEIGGGDHEVLEEMVDPTML